MKATTYLHRSQSSRADRTICKLMRQTERAAKRCEAEDRPLAAAAIRTHIPLFGLVIEGESEKPCAKSKKAVPVRKPADEFEELFHPGCSVHDVLELLTPEELEFIFSGDNEPTHESAARLRRSVVERKRLVMKAEAIAGGAE